MAKILRTGDYVTVVYSDGYTTTLPETEDGQLFVNAVLYQDDEEELQKFFPKRNLRTKSNRTKLEDLKKIYAKKKGE